MSPPASKRAKRAATTCSRLRRQSFGFSQGSRRCFVGFFITSTTESFGVDRCLKKTGANITWQQLLGRRQLTQGRVSSANHLGCSRYFSGTRIPRKSSIESTPGRLYHDRLEAKEVHQRLLCLGRSTRPSKTFAVLLEECMARKKISANPGREYPDGKHEHPDHSGPQATLAISISYWSEASANWFFDI